MLDKEKLISIHKYYENNFIFQICICSAVTLFACFSTLNILLFRAFDIEIYV